MINDRVNCNKVYYFLDIQTPYNLTTFLYIAKVSIRNPFYLLRQGGGLCKGVAV